MQGTRNQDYGEEKALINRSKGKLGAIKENKNTQKKQKEKK